MSDLSAPALLPMLAVAADTLPEGEEWAYELKWDGVRALARLGGGGVRLTSRTGNDVTACYPELEELAAAVAGGTVLDGEVVALDEDARPSFQLLQRRIHVSDPRRARLLASSVPVCFFAFDLLVLGGSDLLDQPYERRRGELEALSLSAEHLSVPPRLDVAAATALEVAGSCGLEGVVAKRRRSRYEPGRRSPAWRKVKLTTTVEVVVCGLLPGQGRRESSVGSLVIAVPGEGGLRYAGKVGTGFRDGDLTELALRLQPLVRPTSPLVGRVDEPLPGVRWLEPEVVGEVAFFSWTAAGRLRGPSWRGLRSDKRPSELEPAPAPRRR
ncbi:MAG TPA: non-homologous end-joining DNA ligase [Acidimicrobiales bacterium]|nr:non-homologous end-joining DNA ligase [Acidimicrobiales bacterium]